MHALNTNEEMKMKKINYFGKEYMVEDDVKWVATSECGNVLAFTMEPWMLGRIWIANGDIGSRIDTCGAVADEWKNSLRKVEDIIVKENELKVGDKVMVNDNINGFKEGQIVELYRLEDDECHLFKGDNDLFTRMCGIHSGAFLSKDEYTIISDTNPHSHADLMLKYAMIAQYDDKPWECFECDVGAGGWVGMIGSLFHEGYNYRLKPQEPKIQVGEIWVDGNGYEVEVTNVVDDVLVTTIHELGGAKIYWSFSRNEFLQNFKRKE